MGDYRGVSELQETPPAAPASPAGTAGQEAPGAAGQPPVKPVLTAGAAKRANASVIGMIIALVLSIATFLPIVLMNPSPKSDGYRPDINVSAVARNAADVAGFTPAAPDTGETFRANYARWESGTGSGVPTWEVGFLTPKESFIGLVQTRQSNPTWLLQQVKSAPVTGTRTRRRPGLGTPRHRQGREEHGASRRRRDHRYPDRIRPAGRIHGTGGRGRQGDRGQFRRRGQRVTREHPGSNSFTLPLPFAVK